jgi:hypothetical protein
MNNFENQVVRNFFENYLIIREKGFDEFTSLQKALFKDDIITVVSDYRGLFHFTGKDAFFEAFQSWAKVFFVNGQSRHEYVVETEDLVVVRLHGELKLAVPRNNSYVSKENQHSWIEEFEIEDNLISKISIEIKFKDHYNG